MTPERRADLSDFELDRAVDSLWYELFGRIPIDQLQPLKQRRATLRRAATDRHGVAAWQRWNDRRARKRRQMPLIVFDGPTTRNQRRRRAEATASASAE